MSVHFKFKSNLDFDTVTFDGLNISVADLKKAIMHQKKIGKSTDFDLQITNAQTKEVYDNEEMLVPKNTSVIVARVPAQQTGNKKNWDKPELPLPVISGDDDLGQIRYDRIAKSADLINANTSEEAKVKAMINQSSQEYDPSKFLKSRTMTGPLPPNYTCFRCGKQGHWIKNCPTNNPDVKRSTGIPRSFMVPVDGPEHKGALLTSSGDYAVPLIDHQAYKEVKKEKPPFVPQDEPNVEPEADIPEELLCMVCKDLLQDAVLIPCCGNSFCDECVRTVLLDSDNHECPVCHEIDVSPNTLIPNRFLRTAVMNYKNETGYTRIKKATFAKASPSLSQREDSPQPSPDSTVESKRDPDEPPNPGTLIQDTERFSRSIKIDIPSIIKKESQDPDYEENDNSSHVKVDDDIPDIQPGTPLADEPFLDPDNENEPATKLSKEERPRIDRSEHRDSSRSRRRHREGSEEVNTISTIETIQTMQRKKFGQRPAPLRQPFTTNLHSHRDDRSDGYVHDREDFHVRYDRRHTDRSSNRREYVRDSRYTSSSRDYPPPNHNSHFNVVAHGDSRRHQDKYRAPPPQPMHLPPTIPPPLFPPIALPPPNLLPPHVFPPQPPPPGASPISTSHITAGQPPPPGVGPVLPPIVADFKKNTYSSEDPLKSITKQDERSIDDRMEAFQRELEKPRPKARASRSRSRSTDRRSRSVSRSRSFSSSKSWTRSSTRSSTRTTRSRSRTPLSSRSRTRSSYTPSRSRSWSKKRSYSRSRSHGRSISRSRSRSRVESRPRRRSFSKERVRTTHRRSVSRSYSPREVRIPTHKNSSYSRRKNFTPPPYLDHYQYGPPQPIMPIQTIVPPSYPPHPYHSMQHPLPPPIHARPIDHYAVERQPKYPLDNQPHKFPSYDRPPKYSSSYGNEYPDNAYNEYGQKYSQSRYDRERTVRYDRRQDYERQERRQQFERQDKRRQEYEREERRQEYDPPLEAHRIPGWVCDRSREQKSRYWPREDRQAKAIKELPHVTEAELKEYRIKSDQSDLLKKKEEKISSKHKKHHHHKTKESRKLEKSTADASSDKPDYASKHLEIKVDKQDPQSDASSKISKMSEKLKEKKHKHKKHKMAEQVVKKKKSKREKIEVLQSTDSDIPTKIKKKRLTKLKADSEEKPNKKVKKVIKESVEIKEVNETPETKKELPVDEPLPKTTKLSESDVLDIFADTDTDVADLIPEIPIEEEIVKDINTSEENIDPEAENNESAAQSEEEMDEETVEEEKEELRVDLPVLSKWEREDIEEDDAPRVQRKNIVEVPKEEKESLSSDILHRAERALLSKPPQPMSRKEGSISEDSSGRSSPEVSKTRRKDAGELKSVVNSERLKSDGLKVTILNNKEKRSVYTKRDSGKAVKEEQKDKKIRLDKINFKTQEEFSVYRLSREEPKSSRDEHKSREHRDRPDRRDRRHSPTLERMEGAKTSSRDRREHKKSDKIGSSEKVHREDKKHRVAEHRKHSIEHSKHEKSEKIPTGYSRSKKSAVKQESHAIEEKEHKISSQKRSRSESVELPASPHRKRRTRDIESQDMIKHEKASSESARRKHSPIRAPEVTPVKDMKIKVRGKDYDDVTKFEPDYDEYSDVEEKREKMRQKNASSEKSRKKIKLEVGSSITRTIKNDKVNVSSSGSSSEVSESESSDSDERKERLDSDSDQRQKHKRARHKKHKKHKHKHKKKKSIRYK